MEKPDLLDDFIDPDDSDEDAVFVTCPFNGNTYRVSDDWPNLDDYREPDKYDKYDEMTQVKTTEVKRHAVDMPDFPYVRFVSDETDNSGKYLEA